MTISKDLTSIIEEPCLIVLELYGQEVLRSFTAIAFNGSNEFYFVLN